MVFFEITSGSSLKIPTILFIGYSDVDNAYGPLIRDEYIVHYVVAGKGYFNGQPVKAGQGFLITPGMMTEYRYDENDPWAYLWFKSDDPNIEPFFKLHNATNNVFSYKNIDEMQSAINSLTSCRSKRYTQTEIEELFLHIFNSCIMNEEKDSVSSAVYYCDYCKKYIDFHLDRPLSVSNLCEVVGITQPYLYKIFMRELGISPKKYIVRAKIRRAKALLSDTDTSILVIASSLGFPDTISFSKFFKSSVGISPSAYRQSKVESGL